MKDKKWEKVEENKSARHNILNKKEVEKESTYVWEQWTYGKFLILRAWGERKNENKKLESKVSFCSTNK